jgi:ferredoxin-NADP reductase
LVGPPSGFTLPVVSCRQLTPTTHAIEVEKRKAFTFAPTQFTFLQLLTEEGMDARPMSLATSPTRPHLEYAVRLSDSSYKRAFAALQPEDDVHVFGPIGDFVLHERRLAILVAGGIGVTPLKDMAEYAADRALPIPIRLVCSNRSDVEIAYRDELEALERQNAYFRCSTRSAAPPTAEGRAGPDGSIEASSRKRLATLTTRPITSAAPPAW